MRTTQAMQKQNDRVAGLPARLLCSGLQILGIGEQLPLERGVPAEWGVRRCCAARAIVVQDEPIAVAELQGMCARDVWKVAAGPINTEDRLGVRRTNQRMTLKRWEFERWQIDVQTHDLLSPNSSMRR